MALQRLRFLLLVTFLTSIFTMDISTCPSNADNVFRIGNTLLERPFETDTIIIKNTRMQEFTCAYDLSQPFTRFSPVIASSHPEQFLCHDLLLHQDPITASLHRLCLARLIVNGAVIDTTTLIPDHWDQPESSPACLVGGTTVFTNRAHWNRDCQSIDLPSGYHREHATTRELVMNTMQRLNLTWQDLVTYDQLPSPQNLTQSLYRLRVKMGGSHQQQLSSQPLLPTFLPHYSQPFLSQTSQEMVQG